VKNSQLDKEIISMLFSGTLRVLEKEALKLAALYGDATN